MLFSAAAQAAPAQDGLLDRLLRFFRQTQNENQLPKNQWKRFLGRQTVSPHLKQQRDNTTAYILEQLNTKKNLEDLVPSNQQERFLLRLERNLEEFPPRLSHAKKQALLKEAAQIRFRKQKELTGRYIHLQACLNRHPRLSGYALNPQPDSFFSRVRFYAPYGTLSAYQTAEDLLCSSRAEQTFPLRRVKTRLTDQSFILQFPAADQPDTQLKFIFSQPDHILFMRLEKLPRQR